MRRNLFEIHKPQFPKVLFFSPIDYGIQDVFIFTNLNWHVGIFIQKQNKHSLKTPIISLKESEL